MADEVSYDNVYSNSESDVIVMDTENPMNAVEEPVAEPAPEEPAQDPAQDHAQDPAQDPTQDPTQDDAQDPAQDAVEDAAQDTAQDAAQDTAEDAAQDAAQDDDDQEEDEPAPVPVGDVSLDQEPIDTDKSTIPDVVFVIPYKNREKQLAKFQEKMTKNLANVPYTYKLLVVNQNDNREFNRGAVKNIGFLYVKHTYPDDYRNITLVFNDVDTYPIDESVIPDYRATRGIVKHFYGYKQVLGGIVAINAADYEAMNGFPNYWSWGFEDNMLLKRAIRSRLVIDRSVFYPIGNSKVYQELTTPFRKVNPKDFNRYKTNDPEGIRSIKNIKLHSIDSIGGGDKLNVTFFTTGHHHDPAYDRVFDSSKSNTPFRVGYSSKRRASMNILL